MIDLSLKRQDSFEVLGRCLDLYIPTWMHFVPTVNALQDVSRSPLRDTYLDISVGYTGAIHVTRLNVLVYQSFFTFVEVSNEDCIIWSGKKPPRSVASYWRPCSGDEKQKRSGLSLLSSLDSQVTSFSFCLPLNVCCWTTQPSSFCLFK